ncbi:hypothetical protein PRIPAC_91416 [Pristionchus pacificus]|uniref:Uncharacterized protein n=1 Tax=Pristionchus pacificus TaxID=54126 RepID=A0A2A6CJ94_PRIPA|nr:hypothetical protein PRIPAC_91416 [Pristionchus pacificus]|eukprot:PDM78081.1 hypothetical protein PRIPAC_30466 [Pristionchus pacificus]
MVLLFILFAFLSFTEAKIIPSDPSKLATSPWPSGAYCIMQAGSTCPSPFSPNELKLSVPIEILPGMTDHAGNTLIQLGRAGNSFVVSSSYDNVYTLGLTFCCKNS